MHHACDMFLQAGCCGPYESPALASYMVQFKCHTWASSSAHLQLCVNGSLLMQLGLDVRHDLQQICVSSCKLPACLANNSHMIA